MSEIPDRLRQALADQYEFLEELGSGGMATVYLANDLKHDRKVAIKVLRPELAAVIGGERFIAEIRTTASLQHPHILPLFDSGEADRFLYYVMPYVEGESLRDRLDRDKQLPVEESIRIAKAVASALHYAHERDIVHRDIKPANILMHAGEPVVADFGIAIAISAAGGGRLTETGMSVGTPHYMSPEQASADRDVDARSDTYAVACVLYEMLAGQPPHTGPTAQAVLMRILTENPRDITDVRRSVPKHVRDALSKGLEKLPADRFPSSKAFADALEDPSFQYAPVVVDATVQALPAVREEAPRRSPLLTWLPAGVALVGGLALGASFFGGGGEPSGVQSVARFEVGGLDGYELYSPSMVHASPDGQWFAFIGSEVGEGESDDLEGAEGIFIRARDELGFRYMDGTAEAAFMSFSPDGGSIVYASEVGSLHVVPSAGGTSREIAPEPATTRIFPWWVDNETILFFQFDQNGTFLARIASGGGSVEELARIGGTFAADPRMLPDGRSVVFADPDQFSVNVVGPDDPEPRVLIPGSVWATTVLDGEAILYVDARGALWASRFDARENELVGDPVPMLNGIILEDGLAPSVSLTADGTLVYSEGASAGRTTRNQELLVLGFDGTRTEIPIARRRYRNVRWSPDGSSIAFAALIPDEALGRTSIYTYNVDLRTATERLTDGTGVYGFPVWSPEGDRLAYLHSDASVGPDADALGGITAGDLAILDLETGEVTMGPDEPGQDVPYAWSSNGEVLYTGGAQNVTSDLLIARPESGSLRETYLNIDGDLGAATVSPDGNWAAFRTSREQGEGIEIVARSFPEAGPPIPVSDGWGDRPRWSADGSAIYYWKSDSEVDSLMKANVRTEPTFEVVSTEMVLSGSFDYTGTWDLHPDGDRMVIAVDEIDVETETEDTPEPRHLVVLNWLSEVRAALGLEN